MSAPGRWSRVIVLSVGLLGVGTAAAAERVHTVAAGESAASLAKKFYGDRDLGELLLRYNGRMDKMIHPGERLTIPFCETYRARAGDTWSGLAKLHLGRASASPALAELNGYAAGQALPVDARIVFPVVLRHTLARGETLSSVAGRFYGDVHRGTVIQAFSRIDDANRLAVGTPLEIPLVAFVRREAEPTKHAARETAAVAAPPPPDARHFESPLADARRLFADGEYDHAHELLEALRERVTGEGSAADRREWGELLAFVYVALDRDDDACTAYRSGVPSAGPAEFDPDLISPRIRAVLTQCAAASPSPERLDNPGPPPQVPLHAGTRG